MEKLFLVLLCLIRDLVADPLSMLLGYDSLEKWVHEMRKKIHVRVARKEGSQYLLLVDWLDYDLGEDGPEFVYIGNQQEYASWKKKMSKKSWKRTRCLVEEIKLF